MKNLKLLMVVSIMVTTFIASAQQPEMQEHNMHNLDKEQVKENRLEKLKTELDLTEEQEAEIKALMDERQKEMEKHRLERKEAMKVMREKHDEQIQAAQKRQKAHDAKMKDILSPEQYEKYEQLNKEQRAEMKGKKKDRRKSRMDGRQNRMPKEKSAQE